MRNFVTSIRRSRRVATVLLVGTTLSLVSAVGADAARLTVCEHGCRYTTIAAALAATHNGDTIAVGRGTFSGGFTIRKSIHVVGDGQHSTTIKGGSSVVTIAKGATVTISRVTISGGRAFIHGGGIDNDGMLTLSTSTVRDNLAGIDIFAGEGGGIYNDRGQLKLTNSTVEHNTATLGGGIHNFGGSVLIRRSRIAHNFGSPVGGGQPAGDGGGLYNAGTLVAFKTALVENTATGGLDSGFGGGIWNEGTATFIDSHVSENTASSLNIAASGGGIVNLLNATMTLKRTPVSHNTATSPAGSALGGGIENGGALTLIKSPVTANAALGLEAGGGGIANLPGASLKLIMSPVLGNTPDNCGGC
jgi:hypothetical protein